VATFNDSEKNARFFGVSEVPVTTSNGGAYSLLCMGLTSSANDGSATISDIGFYSPEELVDKYSVLSNTVKSLKTGLATDSVFVYGDYKYRVADASTLKLTKMLSTGTSVSDAPATLFGYNVDKAVAQNLETIQNNGGDATSLVTNTTFDTNADGWAFVNDHESSKKEIDRWNGSSWRGGNNYYVDCNNRWYTISQTLSNMPAGTYKLVAAMRGKEFGIRPSLASTNGDYWYGTNEKMINKNGVVMPVTDITKNGMNFANDGTQWNWVSVTANLATDGDLTIAFKMEANNGCWACLDDVHLYYSETADGFYQITSENNNVPAEKVVTCDIVLTNPNSIITSNEAITTASGAALNNNLVGTNIAQLVLYDGADYTFSMSSAGTYTINNSYGAAKFYRSLTENTYCTICLPFTPDAGSGTYYEPTKLSDGSLTISEVADKDLKPNTPYILKPSGNYNDIWNNNNADNSEKYNVKYTNNQPATEVDGGKMWFTGRLEKQNVLGSWSGNYYVLGTDNELHKISVDGTVTVNPFRAYFYVAGSSSARTIRISLGDKVTGVENVEAAPAEAKEGKFIKNGKLVIVKNGQKFNAAGAKLY
jgi:hypothetical protein